MNDQRLSYLFDRYLSQSCTPQERKELAMLCLLPENQSELDKLLEKAWEQQSLGQDMPGEKGALILERILRPQIPEEATETQRGKVRRLTWLRIAVAASILIAVFFIFRKEQTNFVKTDQPIPENNAIVPGGDRAILTLANGTQINLDTVNNGTLARQGGSSVIKAGGQLSYNTEAGTSKVVYNTISTPKGGQYQLELADGTRVWLNSATTLRFPTSFVGTERSVELNGEAYFEVAHNAKQPFKVQKGEMEVTVLGTHFNINSYDNEPAIRTTLLEGRVLVSRVQSAGKSEVYLNPGQQAILSPGETNIRIANNVDVEEVIAWKTGRFLFKNTDLASIMRQVERWYDVDVLYYSQINETISGGLARSESVTQLLKILEATGKLEFKIEGRKITVRSK